MWFYDAYYRSVFVTGIDITIMIQLQAASGQLKVNTFRYTCGL